MRRPFPPGLQRLSCLCSWPFPPDLMAGAREPGVCSPSLRPWNSHVLGWLAPSLGLLDAFGSLCTFIVAAPGGLEGLPREGTPQGRDPVCPLTPSSSRGLPSAKEDEDEDVAALRAAPPPPTAGSTAHSPPGPELGEPGWGRRPRGPVHPVVLSVCTCLMCTWSSPAPLGSWPCLGSLPESAKVGLWAGGHTGLMPSPVDACTLWCPP